MIEILHDLMYQNPGTCGSIVHMGSCSISIINSIIGICWGSVRPSNESGLPETTGSRLVEHGVRDCYGELYRASIPEEPMGRRPCD